MAGNAWKWPEMAGTAGNEWSWLEMAVHGWTFLKMDGMAGNAWKRLEMEGQKCKNSKNGQEYIFFEESIMNLTFI